MKRTNAEIRKQARQALETHWADAAIVSLIYFFICPFIIWFSRLINHQAYFYIVWSLLCIPIHWGYTTYFQLLFQGKKPGIKQLFIGYADFRRIFGTGFLQGLYTFLAFLLFIIPGLIRSLDFSFVSFLLQDNPQMKYHAALRESRRLMKGYKMKLLMLYLSYLGWAGLCILTFGFGFLILQPYIRTSVAAFYHDITGKEIAPAPASAPQAE